MYIELIQAEPHQKRITLRSQEEAEHYFGHPIAMGMDGQWYMITVRQNDIDWMPLPPHRIVYEQPGVRAEPMTWKQRKCIHWIENVLHEDFHGSTKEEARQFISENIEQAQNISALNSALIDTYHSDVGDRD